MHKTSTQTLQEGESNEEEEETTTSSEKSEQDSESDTSTEDEDESNTTQTLQVHNALNNIMHDEDNSIHDQENSSEDENDTSDENSVIEIETPINNGDQNSIHENKLLTTNFEVKVENGKVEGLITYSTDQ